MLFKFLELRQTYSRHFYDLLYSLVIVLLECLYIHIFFNFCLLFKHGMVNGASHPPPLERSPCSNVFHVVEGFALVTLCSSRPATRRLAVSVLREIRALFALLEIPKVRFRHLIQLPNEST